MVFAVFLCALPGTLVEALVIKGPDVGDYGDLIGLLGAGCKCQYRQKHGKADGDAEKFFHFLFSLIKIFYGNFPNFGVRTRARSATII